MASDKLSHNLRIRLGVDSQMRKMQGLQLGLGAWLKRFQELSHGLVSYLRRHISYHLSTKDANLFGAMGKIQLL